MSVAASRRGGRMDGWMWMTLARLRPLRSVAHGYEHVVIRVGVWLCPRVVPFLASRAIRFLKI